MKNLLKILTIVLAALLAGCASTSDNEVKIPLDSDPRIGETVSRVCFSRSIDSWSTVDNDPKAVILKMSNRESYKLKLSGVCDPEWAMSTLAVITRPGAGCLSRGDKVKTDADISRGFGSACIIRSINKWNPEAVKSTE